MNTIFIGNTSVTFSDNKLIGKGGEADVFDIGGGEVLKLFKPSTHPDYENNLKEQKGAIIRLDEHQMKLPHFPLGLPEEVISPRELAKDRSGRILGYTMPFLNGTEVLLKYGEKSFRNGGISDETVVLIFQNLLLLVQALHEKNVIAGDFNDLNILIKGITPYIIDADSMQYGKWQCKVFTGKFVDPLLCDSNKKYPYLIKPHNELSDYYALAVMLMQSLLFVGPYGGVYKPKDKTKRVAHDARSLHGISVWHPEVCYPKPARPLDILPDSLQQDLQDFFVHGKRKVLRSSFLDSLQFNKFGELKSVAKPSIAPSVVKEIVTGTVTAEKIFSTSGYILYATVQNGRLRWLYHSNTSYKREDGNTIFSGELSPNIRFRIAGDKTILGKKKQAVIFNKDGSTQNVSVDAIGNLPLIDANLEGLVYSLEGKLNRINKLGTQYSGEFIGEVFPNQTLFWVSEKLGFAFYRAAKITRYCIFNPNKTGLNDSIILPKINGKITDVSCKFSSNYIWFSLSIREGAKSVNYCYLLNKDGKLIASAKSPQGDGSWLGEIQGACAVANMLLVPTDDGIQKVQAEGDTLVVTKEFSDTARFVDTSSHLFPAKEGIYVKSSKEIWKLTI